MKKNTILFILFVVGAILPDVILLILRRGFKVYISIPVQNQVLLGGAVVTLITLSYYLFGLMKGERKWYSHFIAALSFLALLYTAFTFLLIEAANQAMNSFF